MTWQVFSQARHSKKRKAKGLLPAIYLDEPALTDLKWWVNHLAVWNGRSILAPKSPDVVFDTDASTLQWGAVCHAPWSTRRDFFRTHEMGEHITLKELKAILFGLQSFAIPDPGVRLEEFEAFSKDGQLVRAELREQL